jgi:hypothetical protein
MKDWELNPEDEENAVLQNLDGTLRISLGSERIKLTADQVSVEIKSTGITMTGNVTVIGALIQTNGGPQGGSTATMAGSLQINGPSVKHQGTEIGRTHTHGGVQTGSGTTGAVS